MAKIKITQVKSKIGSTDRQKRTLEALGLTKINKTVVKNDTPTIRGMIKVVSHLVDVVEEK